MINRMRPQEAYRRALVLRERCGVEFFEKYSKQFVNTDCPVCGSEGDDIFKKYGYQHRKCRICRTMWCSHRPTEELLAEYYSNWEAPKYWTQLLLQTDVDRKALQYTPRVYALIDILKKDREVRRGVAVDLGAGSGAFAVSMKQANFFRKVVAVDVDEDCCRVCAKNGLESRHGSVDDLEAESVDLLTMNDMIEHVFDPMKVLRRCYGVLRRNGYVSIACPNGEGFDFRIMKEKTVNITPPEHLNYFNPQSLKTLLELVGFDNIVVETPGILDTEIVRREILENRLDMENNEYLRYLLLHPNETLGSKLQEFLQKNQLSSHMLVVAKKV